MIFIKINIFKSELWEKWVKVKSLTSHQNIENDCDYMSYTFYRKIMQVFSFTYVYVYTNKHISIQCQIYFIIKVPWDMKDEENYFSICNNLTWS